MKNNLFLAWRLTLDLPDDLAGQVVNSNLFRRPAKLCLKRLVAARKMHFEEVRAGHDLCRARLSTRGATAPQ